MITRRGLLGACLWAVPLAARAAPEFALEDQWEKRIDHRVVFRARVVLLGGDQRETGERIGAWAAELRGLPTYGIADLDALPFFVPKSSVRSNLKEVAPRTSVLLDWDGSVYAPRLGFPREREICVQIHEAGGRLVERVEGEVTAARAEKVREIFSRA